MMNCVRNNAYFGSCNARPTKVFHYNSRPSLVVKVVESDQYQARCWVLETHAQWQQWLESQCNDADRGLVMILASRTEQSSLLPPTQKISMSISTYLNSRNDFKTLSAGLRHTTTFATLGEGQSKTLKSESPRKDPGSVRNLPFDKATFETICKRFQMHESITRVVSRADVPCFMCEEAEMIRPALVYNCRTSNAWENDIALSATHYSSTGLTYAILYGCSVQTEQQILKKLQGVREESAHPLIAPGLLAELELARHSRLVEVQTTEVETYIMELSVGPSSPRRAQGETSYEGRRNAAKRSAWLNLTYLKNSIVTWNKQIDRMIERADRLTDLYASDYLPLSPLSSEQTVTEDSGSLHHQSVNKAENLGPSISPDISTDLETPHDTYHGIEEKPLRLSTLKNNLDGAPEYSQRVIETWTCMRDWTQKIRTRLSSIQAENEEKIRDCMMRMDGMAMATQWSHSETAVEIAMATRNDSQVMRSISLITMVFLPGTFFATVFSMTFFDWQGQGGGPKVSNYLWIYVVVTIFFTGCTIGLWYYFVIHRRTKEQKNQQPRV